MLESLFNKVTGLQHRFYFSWAKTLKNFINFLTNYVLLRNVKCKVMLTEAYLEPSRTSTMELFSLWLSHNLKMYFSKLPLGSIFCTTHPFGKKPKTLKTSGEKIFC